MHKLPARAACLPLIAVLGVAAARGTEQRPGDPAPQSAEEPIARTSARTIKVAGAVDLNQGEMLLGNGSTVTAEGQPVTIALTRGGELRLCSTTSLHLARDRSVAAPASTALMMALDRGALETDYTVGKYSDVLLTPDLRILISGPGKAAVSVRVNAQGDTCVDNHGANAPYVTVSSQLEGGLYRVLPDQRVTFEHGSIREVVDHETEACGCPPPPVSIADAGAPSRNPAKTPLGGPSSTPADTAFPTAVSEGLAPPALATKPVVPAGEAHAEVTVPLTYQGELATASPQESTGAPELSPSLPGAQPAIASSIASPPAWPGTRQGGFFHRVGRFFSRVFGK